MMKNVVEHGCGVFIEQVCILCKVVVVWRLPSKSDPEGAIINRRIFVISG